MVSVRNIQGLTVSNLTLGTVQLGMNYGIANKAGKPSRESGFSILRTAVEGGINSFDTAAQYGDSEDVLGQFFSVPANRPDPLILSTKLDLLPGEVGEQPDPGQLERVLRGHVEQSLRRLGLNKLPIYLLHRADDVTRYGRSLSRILSRVQRENLLGQIGVSVYTSAEVDAVLADDVYRVIQIPMNVLDHRLTESGAMQRMQDRGIAIFVRSVFLQGLFFKKPEELGGNLTIAREPVRLLQQMADREGLSVAQLAIAYIRDLKGVASLVIGAETTDQLRENMMLIESPAIGEKTRSEIRKSFAGLPETILNPGLWRL
ncbi:MAG: aldo/keto reductase [Clostridiaceae bacterium]|nr:aldo/keto reductase [Clostridiaceae bacterium]